MKDIPKDQIALYKEVGARIANRRKELGMTQEALAAHLKMSRAGLSNIERGSQRLLLHTVWSLAITLKVHPHELLPERPDESDADLTKDEIAGLRKFFSRFGFDFDAKQQSE